MRDAAALAGAARPGWAGRIEQVVGADRPPRVRRLGVGGEDRELIVAFDANSGDHDRQVAWALRLAGNSLRVIRHRRAQNDGAALVAAGKIDLKARKGRSG
jgi:hypothetical protein